MSLPFGMDAWHHSKCYSSASETQQSYRNVVAMSKAGQPY